MQEPSFRHYHSAPVGGQQTPLTTSAVVTEQDSEQIGRFVIGETLGSGTFSIVKLAVHTGTGRKVALKILSKKKIDAMGTEERVGREIRHLRLCAVHPHLTRLYDVVESPKRIVLATEYVSGGELFDHISGRNLESDEARRFFQQIVSGVEFMHYKRVVHRDLKLENILLDASRLNVKIIDFGLSSYVREGELMHTACGSPHYAAPEIVVGKPYSGYGVDIWSVGVILFAMLSGTLPFHENDIREQFRKIKGGIYSIPSHLPFGVRYLIKGMIEVDTEKRMDIEAIRANHWFRHNLPPYLKRSPDATEKEERRTVDTKVVDEVLKLYSSTPIPHKGKVTRELIKSAVAHKTDADTLEDEPVNEIRDIQCAYRLILDDKRDREHSVQLLGTKGQFGLAFWLKQARKRLN